MKIQTALAMTGGNTWRSYNMVAVWFYPAIMIGHHRIKVTSDDYRCFTRLLRPGDFLLTKSEPFFMSNKAIAGTAFKHLIIYTGAIEGTRDPETGFILKPKSLANYKHSGEAPMGIYERSITHAIKDGVVTQDLYDIFQHTDYIASIRPWITSEQQKIIVETALQQNGLEYNFEFKPGKSPKHYCTELGEFCCKKAGIEPPNKTKINISYKKLIFLWRDYSYPVILADHFVKFKMICNSMSCNNPAFYRSSDIVNELRQAINESEDATTHNHKKELI